MTHARPHRAPEPVSLQAGALPGTSLRPGLEASVVGVAEHVSLQGVARPAPRSGARVGVPEHEKADA